MLFLEEYVRPLLALHAIVAAVLVGGSTHHVLWCRGYGRGRFGRRNGERRFALITTMAFVATFVIGNLLYPTYKVRVRAEYLDSPAAVAADRALRSEERARVAMDGVAPRGAGAQAVTRATRTDLSSIGRLFDIKEHWAALGCAASLLLLLLSRFAHPSIDRRVLPLYLGLSIVVCTTAWAGVIIGLVTVSFRSVGALP